MQLILILFLLLPSVAHANLRQGLVGWWKLDEKSGNNFDSSWRGHTGTPTNITFVNSCQKTNCNFFNGNNSVITMANQADFQFTATSKITISAWVRQNLDLTFPVFAKTSTTGFQPGYYFIIIQVNNAVYFGLNGSGSETLFRQANMDLMDGQWHHVAATYDGTADVPGIRLFADGIETGYAGGTNSGFTTSTSISNTASELIGSALGSFIGDGTVDDIRVYNRLLTDQEIQDLASPGVIIKNAIINNAKINY